MTRTDRRASRAANLESRYGQFVKAAKAAGLDERQYRRESQRHRTAARTAGRASKALNRGD